MVCAMAIAGGGDVCDTQRSVREACPVSCNLCTSTASPSTLTPTRAPTKSPAPNVSCHGVFDRADCAEPDLSNLCHLTYVREGCAVLCRACNFCEPQPGPDGVLAAPCHPDEVCVSDSVARGHTCECRAGFEPDAAGVCSTDINECDASPCAHYADCMNTRGSSSCSCRPGFVGDPLVECVDVSECSDSTNNCAATAICEELPGSFSCVCDRGHYGNGTACTACPTNSEPSGPDTVWVGSACVCLAGFYLEGSSCAACDANAAGTLSNENDCVCNVGFSGTGDVCLDIEECRLDQPCAETATCTELVGTFSCACNAGYTGTGTDCADVNECTEALFDDATAPCSASRPRCINTVGAFDCVCAVGWYEAPGVVDGPCMADDECAAGVDSCHADNSVCVNTAGSFRCDCEEGFVGNPAIRCVDLDECGYPDTASRCHSHSTCANNDGSFTCACNMGFTGNGSHCRDVNECEFARCHEHGVCTNLPGTYSCTCQTGFVETGLGVECGNVDECSAGTDNCGHQASCVDSDGSFNCVLDCTEGFRPEGIGCVNINECDLGLADCGVHGDCQDQDGSFVCVCRSGWSMSETGRCEFRNDFNECTEGTHNCAATVHCLDLPGSFECMCNIGFTGDGMQCSDLNECDSPGNCATNAACTNTAGSFDCVCAAGYFGDGVDCAACSANADDFTSSNNNDCRCNAGFAGDGAVCADIQECSQDPGPCPTFSVCAEELGSYLCECFGGFEGPDCIDTDECLLGRCPAGAECTDTTGSYFCTCDEGDYWNGTACTDFNECVYSLVDCQGRTWSDASCASAASVCDGVTCSSSLNGDPITTCQQLRISGFRDGVCLDRRLASVGDAFPDFGCREFSCDGGDCVRGDCRDIAQGFILADPSAYLCSRGSHQDCVNVNGSFACQCAAGFNAVSEDTCEDINECESFGNVCDSSQRTCVNTAGSYLCTSCDAGFAEADDGTCDDINECTFGASVCSSAGSCANADGSYSCTCNVGYSGDGQACIDVNECAEGPACNTEEICVNLIGGFVCLCDEGFALINGTCEDLNECGRDASCDPDALCSDGRGSFTCVCNAGFTGTGTSCEDIRECTPASGESPCDPAAVCEERPGTFVCRCNTGFNGNGVFCSDVDECGHGGPDHSCPDNSVCLNIPGSYQCDCYPGYGATSTDNCVNVNECSGDNTCGERTNCVDIEGSYTCTCMVGFTDGEETAGLECTDDDECELGTHTCDDNAHCTNSPGTFSCTCNLGWSSIGSHCEEIDECVTPTSLTCHTNASCQDRVGYAECACNPGFEGDGVYCSETDECQGATCHASATCIDLFQGHECRCNSGWAAAGDTCLDVNECLSSPCSEHSTCVNSDGTFTCGCNSGFAGSGLVCTDVDECTAGSHDCHVRATCIDSSGEGGYRCDCSPGWAGAARSVTSTNADVPEGCANVNECNLAQPPCDDPATSCVDTPGSYRCGCNRGFQSNGTACVDTDECADSRNTCRAAQLQCFNADGSYSCGDISCPSGFIVSGADCVNRDECVDGSNTCSPNARCVDDFGSFICTCMTGYNGNGHTCDDVDECAQLPCTSAQSVCNNVGGSFECLCNVGYSGSICGNIDECLDSTATVCPANATCIDTAGSFECGVFLGCPTGFHLGDWAACSDVDECTVGTGADGDIVDCGQTARCANTPGSFVCACSVGHAASNEDGECEDLNECGLGTHSCSDGAGVACANSDGSFTCVCVPGYQGDGNVCREVDECAIPGRCGEHASCVDTVGSFECECEFGYARGNSGECSQLDMCTAGGVLNSAASCHSQATCSNAAPGYFHCACNEGFHGTGVECSDNDECLRSDDCSAGASCTNTHGSFTCACRSGFVGNGTSCADVNECADGGSAPCPAHIPCTNIDGSFTCAAECSDGYVKRSQVCVNVNECLDDVVPCGDPSLGDCVDTVGSFRCECHPGARVDSANGRTFCLNIDECTEGYDSCEHVCQDQPGSFTCQCHEGYAVTATGACDNTNECLDGVASCDAECVDTEGSFYCSAPTPPVATMAPLDSTEPLSTPATSPTAETAASRTALVLPVTPTIGASRAQSDDAVASTSAIMHITVALGAFIVLVLVFTFVSHCETRKGGRQLNPTSTLEVSTFEMQAFSPSETMHRAAPSKGDFVQESSFMYTSSPDRQLSRTLVNSDGYLTVGNREMLSPGPDGYLTIDNTGPLAMAMASPTLRPPSALDPYAMAAASPRSALDPGSSIPVFGLSHWARSPQPAIPATPMATSAMSPLNDSLPRYSMDDQPVSADIKKRPEDIFIPN